MSKELYVVDETGIIVDTVDAEDSYVKFSAGDRVLRKGTIDFLSNTVDVKYRFIKLNPLAWSKIGTKYPIMNKLLYYIGFMDNVLVYNNGKIIKPKDIAKVCGVSEATAKRQLRGLQEDDIIHKKKDENNRMTYLVVNPYICMRGKKITSTLYKEFKLSVWRNEIEE